MRVIGKRKGFLWLFVFCVGMVLGTILVNYMVKTSRINTSVLMVYIQELSQKAFDDIYFFIYLCVSRLAAFLLLAAFVYMFRSPVIFYVITAFFGAAFGCTVSMAALAYGSGGILMAAALFFPQYIVYVPVYIFLLKMVDNNQFDDTIKHTSVNTGYRSYAMIAGVLATLIIIGCALESYVNPIVVEQAAKIF